MQRIKLMGIVTLGLCVLYSDIDVKAQDTENQQEGRGQREGGRRGRGGFGRGFPGGGGFGGGGFFPGGGGGRGGSSLMGLLVIGEVQEEINLRDHQRELVRAFGEELRDERPDFPTNFREMSQEEREQFQKKMQEWSAKQAKEAKATLATILVPEQYTRLIEINIQNTGASALADEDVAAKLNLSDEQKAKIAAAIEQNGEKLREEMQTAFQGGRGGEFDFAAMREKMETLRKEGDERVLVVLNDEQKTAFVAMKGEAFKMPERGFGGGRGGGGRGFGGGRGNRPDRPERPE